MVTPHVDAADGDPRLATRHEPERLVVDPHVERPRAEVAVVLHAEPPEDEREQHRSGEHAPRRRMDVEQPALDRVDPVAGLVTVGLRRNRLQLDLGSLRIVAGNDDIHRVHGRRDY